ncbi:AGAP004281-PA [Anopheles gambiae str. PEST]|uniref:AGAP004281-PA n=1 Tax=Anopheles gambiae TaxID=7165 RepID=A0NDH0_ANOGA|nr:uncharacterized protein LOC4577206 [Anopheles gambiae]EAU76990.1 AGAP004281-PA [Anopheles gambiae str. PEST]
MDIVHPFGVPREGGQSSSSQPYYPGAPLFPAHTYNANRSSTNGGTAGSIFGGGISSGQTTHNTMANEMMDTVPVLISTPNTTTSSSVVANNQLQLKPVLGKLNRKAAKGGGSQWCKLAHRAQPMSAFDALCNLCGANSSEFNVRTNGHETMVQTIFNAMQYQAVAPNEFLAKEKVSEEVLRDIYLPRLAAHKDQSETGAMMDTSTQNGMEAEEDPDAKTTLLLAQNLVSFALYKLFAKWNVQPKPTKVKEQPSKNGVIRCREQLPVNPTSHHPATLLSIMVTPVSFEDVGETVVSPARTNFVARVTVGEQSFTGTGQSKKVARKMAASEACKALFGVNYGVLQG